MDSHAEKKFDKLYKRLQKADAASQRALEKYQTTIEKYHWTEADDGWKWKKVLAARNKHTAESKKAENEFTALVEFQRNLLAHH
jgi:hypothetical protein